MKLREIYTSPNYYSVCESDRTEGLVLYVLAGGILMYPVVVELLPDEVTKFRTLGHLDSLAYEVKTRESRFQNRTLKPLGPEDRIEFVDTF